MNMKNEDPSQMLFGKGITFRGRRGGENRQVWHDANLIVLNELGRKCKQISQKSQKGVNIEPWMAKRYLKHYIIKKTTSFQI